MKLNKEAKRTLQTIFNDMQRTELFLLKDSTLLGTISSMTHAKENTWVNAETGKQAGTFNKHVGCDLCYLHNAITRLQCFLNANS